MSWQAVKWSGGIDAVDNFDAKGNTVTARTNTIQKTLFYNWLEEFV